MATHNLLVVGTSTSWRVKPPISRNLASPVTDDLIDQAELMVSNRDTTDEYTEDLFVVLDDRLRKVAFGILKIYKGSGRRYDGEEIEAPFVDVEWLYPNNHHVNNPDKQIDEFASRIIVANEDYYYTTEDALHA